MMSERSQACGASAYRNRFYTRKNSSSLPDVLNVPPCAYLFGKTVFHQLGKRVLYGGRADIRKDITDFLLGYREQAVQNGCFHASLLRDFLGVDYRETFIQFFVAVKQGGNEVLNKREIAVLPVMPLIRA
jgi:hypothetical protein